MKAVQKVSSHVLGKIEESVAGFFPDSACTCFFKSRGCAGVSQYTCHFISCFSLIANIITCQ